jgi:uncharacterized protein (TIGR03000 family)
MFSAVLMVAMTTTPMTPDFGRRRGGCHGCYGGGYSCCGCYGGGYGGCYGGGYGGGYGGCYGGGYGGGYGGCYGGYAMGGGYYGPGMQYMPPADGGMRRGGTGGAGTGTGDRTGTTDRTGRESRPEDTSKPPQALAPTPARVIVQLPADAKLTIDGAPTKSTSERRVFSSPALEPGRTYSYNFEATIVRDGQPVTTRERVLVRAGEVTRVNLTFPEAALTRR